MKNNWCAHKTFIRFSPVLRYSISPKGLWGLAAISIRWFLGNGVTHCSPQGVSQTIPLLQRTAWDGERHWGFVFHTHPKSQCVDYCLSFNSLGFRTHHCHTWDAHKRSFSIKPITLLVFITLWAERECVLCNKARQDTRERVFRTRTTIRVLVCSAGHLTCRQQYGTGTVGNKNDQCKNVQ